MIDMSRYQETSVGALVEIGKKSREALLQCLTDVQNYVGKNAEIHPDFMDTLFDAIDELDLDLDGFIKEWMARG